MLTNRTQIKRTQHRHRERQTCLVYIRKFKQTIVTNTQRNETKNTQNRTKYVKGHIRLCKIELFESRLHDRILDRTEHQFDVFSVWA